MGEFFECVTIRGSLYVVDGCGVCGVVFTIPYEMRLQQYQEGGFAYCPNGHQWGWKKDGSERERLRRERDRLQQQIAQRDDEIAEERSRRLAAEKREARIKGRLSRGVCPCCNRSFSHLEQHMKQKHPEYGRNEVLVLKVANA